MELHGDEDEKTAVADEEQAAQRREHAFPVHQRGRVDLPEEFERHPPKEHDIGEYKILSQIQGREAVQQAPTMSRPPRKINRVERYPFRRISKRVIPAMSWIGR